MARILSRVSAIALTSALSLGIAGVSIATGSLSGAGASTTTANTIVISNFMFKPMIIKVAPGARIKVTNKDTVDHTVTAVDGKFKTGKIGHNQTKYFRAPLRKGIYHYICSIHQFMMGTLIVK